MIFGNMYNLKINISDGTAESQNIGNVVSAKKLLKVISTEDVYLNLTPTTNSTDADTNDYLIKANKEYEFFAGRSLDRIAIYNNSGSDADVYIAVMH